MKTFYYDHLPIDLPPSHRFPANKYRLLREALAANGTAPYLTLLPAPAATDTQILRAHQPDYWRRLQAGTLTRAELRRTGLPWSAGLVDRVRHMAGGTIAAARHALRDGHAANLGGGTHHACYDHGQGYCLVNDVVIAARTMQAEGRARRILVVDADVHQGNGTAQLTRDDPTIYAFSIHGERNFPFRKIPGDLDISLPDDTGDAPYLDAFAAGLDTAIAAARADLLFYLAGADPFAGDSLGRLALTATGLAARDRLLLDRCHSAGLPVVILLAGGYSRPIDATVALYAQTIHLAAS